VGNEWPYGCNYSWWRSDLVGVVCVWGGGGLSLGIGGDTCLSQTRGCGLGDRATSLKMTQYYGFCITTMVAQHILRIDYAQICPAAAPIHCASRCNRSDLVHLLLLLLQPHARSCHPPAPSSHVHSTDEQQGFTRRLKTI
jgi:hypothetical protein